jgi:hypothetical protein
MHQRLRLPDPAWPLEADPQPAAGKGSAVEDSSDYARDHCGMPVATIIDVVLPLT